MRALRCGCALVALGGSLLSGCGASGAKPTSSAPAAGPIRFEDLYSRSGIQFRLGHGGRSPLNILETIGHGAALLDCDDDGRLDILLTGPDQVRLYRNLGDWNFADITDAAGLRQKGYWQGCATGDLDNDGRVDLYLAAKGDAAVYRNLGGGRFRELTPASGLAVRDPNRWNSAAELFDFDNDGRLDLYVGAYVDQGQHSGLCLNQGVTMGCGPLHYRPQKGVLYRNLGSWRFEATAAGALGHGKTLGALAADLDGTGSAELYAANDQMEADLLERQNRTWREIGLPSGTATGPEGSVQGGMGVAAADYNADGRLDLFVTTFQQEPHSLYRNEGGLRFQNVAFPSGVASATTRFVGFGVSFADFDCDTWPDLLIANGHPQELIERVDSSTSYRQPSQLLRNLGNGRFADVTGGGGADLQRPIVGRALCWGDLDNDGRVDALLGDLEGPPLLLRNVSPPKNWLRLRLVGTRSNRSAQGAVVTCEAGGKKWSALCSTGGSYYSASDPRVHFGLGEASSASISIQWPGGGRQRLENVRANQDLVVKQASGD